MPLLARGASSSSGSSTGAFFVLDFLLDLAGARSGRSGSISDAVRASFLLNSCSPPPDTVWRSTFKGAVSSAP